MYRDKEGALKIEGTVSTPVSKEKKSGYKSLDSTDKGKKSPIKRTRSNRLSRSTSSKGSKSKSKSQKSKSQEETKQ